MNNLSRSEFKELAIDALMSINTKARKSGFYYDISIHEERHRAWANFSGQYTRMSININTKEIKISFSDRILYDGKFVYYTYNENDDHYAVINKFKNDMVKNMRQIRKIGKGAENYKIYLYDDEYKNYTNKYYAKSNHNENSRTR